MKKWVFLRAPNGLTRLGLARPLRGDGAAAWLFLAPSAAGFAVFYLIPFGMSLMYSFMSGTSGGSFVGLANYRGSCPAIRSGKRRPTRFISARLASR